MCYFLKSIVAIPKIARLMGYWSFRRKKRIKKTHLSSLFTDEEVNQPQVGDTQ